MKILIKNRSKIVLSIILILTIVMLSGCFGSNVTDKTFTSNGYSITLDSTFQDAKGEDQSTEMLLKNTNIELSVNKDDFESSNYPDAATITADVYARDFVYDYVYIYVDYYSEPYFYQEDDDNIARFDYQYYVSGELYYCYTVVHKGSAAFWISGFSCLNKNRSDLIDDIEKYANSITVE